MRKIIDVYTDDSITHIVEKVILMWNNVENDVPSVFVGHERVEIVRSSKNSLKNRWIETLPHINTDIVLNPDDDVYVKKEGLLRMLNWFNKERTRMVAPFVRRIEGHKYFLDHVYDSSAYSIVLPRILLVPTAYLRAYANSSNAWFHQYVDTNEAHCDDIFLNMVGLEIIASLACIEENAPIPNSNLAIAVRTFFIYFRYLFQTTVLTSITFVTSKWLLWKMISARTQIE